MSDAPPTVFMPNAGEDYTWVEFHGVKLEIKAPDSIAMAYARGQASRVVAQIKSGFDSALEWGTITAEEAEDEDAGKEVRDLVLAVKLAKKITRRWNVSFEKGSTEPSPLDEDHLRLLFKIPRMIEAFWLHVFTAGPYPEPAEGNDFAAALSGDTGTAAKPADSAHLKEKDAPLADEIA
jgi:hypothetical protein